MCRIDLCGQIGVKISSYGDRRFIKINPLNCPMGQFIRREDSTKKLLEEFCENVNRILEYTQVPVQLCQARIY